MDPPPGEWAMSSRLPILCVVLTGSLALALPLQAQHTAHEKTVALASGARVNGHDAKAVDAVTNDNRVSAGHLIKGVFTLQLEARDASWYPEKPSGPAIPVFAFAESGQAPRVPGPMIRVPAGTEMRVSVRNTLSKPFSFRVDIPGSYYYFARTEALPPIPGPGVSRDAMLVGAFVVDPTGTKPPKNERVLLISTLADTIPSLGVKSESADRIMRRELFLRPTW